VSRPRVAVVGPTCTGKTRLAVGLALRRQPAELLNADSRQLRSGTAVATFRPTPEELQGVRCHLLDLAPPGAEYTVAQYATAARAALVEVDRRGALPIVVGGSGLYVRALVDGLDFGGAPPDPAARSARTAAAASPQGVRALAAELTRRDPDAAATIDLRNPRRVIRALEILDARPGPLRDARSQPATGGWVLIGLDTVPATHRRWIEERVSRIFRDGSLLREIDGLLAAGVSSEAIAGSGIGYAEGLALRAGEVDAEEAVARTVQRTRRYAKAQRTWFRRDQRIRWLEADSSHAGALADEAAEVIAAVAVR